MFEQVEISGQIYEGQTPSKKIPRADANRDSHIRERKGGETASPTNPKKGHSGKLKTKMKYIQTIIRLVQIKHACYMAPDIPLRNVKY